MYIYSINYCSTKPGIENTLTQGSLLHACHGLKEIFVVAYRFIPRHADELEMEADDPLLMEMQAEDLWCEAYNMRTGSRGIFPAFYAVKVTKDSQPKGTKYFSKC